MKVFNGHLFAQCKTAVLFYGDICQCLFHYYKDNRSLSGTVENHGKKVQKTRHTLKKSGKNTPSKYNVFLLQQIHDMLMAFFIMDELND